MSGVSEGWDESLPRVVGLLRAGLPAHESWARAGVSPPAHPTSPLDRAVAAADALAARTGAALGSMLLALAQTAADAREAEALRRASLAGPRLSARILAWLPVAGVALGALVDARTVSVLALTPLGWALLAAGAALAWAGRAWTRRIVRVATAAGDGQDDAVAVAAVLVAAALDAGVSVPAAVRAVGEALGDDDLAALGREWPGGDGAARGSPSAWEPLVRVVRPAWEAGASPGPALEALARSVSRRARTDAAVAAGELGVRVAMPLTLCLLPSFVLVGLVPMLVAVVGGGVLEGVGGGVGGGPTGLGP